MDSYDIISFFLCWPFSAGLKLLRFKLFRFLYQLLYLRFGSLKGELALEGDLYLLYQAKPFFSRPVFKMAERTNSPLARSFGSCHKVYQKVVLVDFILDFFWLFFLGTWSLL